MPMIVQLPKSSHIIPTSNLLKLFIRNLVFPIRTDRQSLPRLTSVVMVVTWAQIDNASLSALRNWIDRLTLPFVAV